MALTLAQRLALIDAAIDDCLTNGLKGKEVNTDGKGIKFYTIDELYRLYDYVESRADKEAGKNFGKVEFKRATS